MVVVVFVPIAVLIMLSFSFVGDLVVFIENNVLRLVQTFKKQTRQRRL